jgi:hypothetical protein
MVERSPYRPVFRRRIGWRNAASTGPADRPKLAQTDVDAMDGELPLAESGRAAEQPRLTAVQRRYLARGLGQPGGKLPLFDAEGRQVPRQTVESCIAHGWAEVWFANPLKPDWLVCRLTAAGFRILGERPPGSPPAPPAAD